MVENGELCFKQKIFSPLHFKGDFVPEVEISTGRQEGSKQLLGKTGALMVFFSQRLI